MNKIKKTIACVLAFVMIAILMYGCSQKTTIESSDSASSSVETSTAETSAAETSAAETSAAETSAAETTSLYSEYTYPAADVDSEVYTMQNRIPWAGLITPVIESRADIYKGLETDNRKDNIKVGFATWTNKTPFFVAGKDMIEEKCEEYGYEFVMVVSDGDINKQIANIESLVTMGVDVIIDCAYSIEAETAAVENAVEAGIPVIGWGTPFAADSPIVTTSVSNYYEQGFIVGRKVAEEYKDTYVTAALLPGQTGHKVGESKINGWIGGFIYERAIQLGTPFATREEAMLIGYNYEQEIVKSARFSTPEYSLDVVVSIDGGWTREGGQSAMEDIITAHPDINFVFTDDDQEAMGAIMAMEQAGINVGTDIKIACAGDGAKEAMELIKDGTLFGMTLASPYAWAGACIDLAYMIFHDGFDATNLPAETYSPDVWVSQGNINEWMPTKDFADMPEAIFMPISS